VSKHRTVGKVTAFITRLRNEATELLVFRHPYAGVQVPAGTIELGESVEEALWREVQEETGLRDVQLIRHLRTELYTTPADQRIIVRGTKIFDAPAFDASGTGYHLKRGLWVRYLGPAEGNFAHIAYEELDNESDPPASRIYESGYVRTSVLGTGTERHHFHLTTPAETPETWPVSTDNHTFQLYWTPLIPRPRLIGQQDDWLVSVYDELLTWQ
jgi:8-oxo-dGTP pyrophosphatase MutT (NUDIX family)